MTDSCARAIRNLAVSLRPCHHVPQLGHENVHIPFDNNTAQSVVVTITGYTVTAGGTCSRDYQAHPSPALTIAAGSSKDFWVTWHDDNSGNNKTMSIAYSYTVSSGPAAGTVFGPYTIPVAKAFNSSCADDPKPTIPAGPCTNPPSEHSNCP